MLPILISTVWLWGVSPEHDALAKAVHRSHASLVSVDYEAHETARTVFTIDGEFEHRQVRFMANGPDRLFSSGHVEDGRSLEQDVDRSDIFFLGRELTVYWPGTRHVERFGPADSNQASMKCRYDLFVEATGWWPPGDDLNHFPEGAWSDPLLHVVVDNPEYRLSNVVEIVDGQECIVLRKEDQDTLWLGRKLGFSVVCRKLARKNQLPARIYRNSGFREVSSGIWLPMSFTRELYDSLPSDSNTESGKLFGVVSRKLTSIRVNDEVEVEALDLTPPSGCIITDRRKHEDIVLPGGHELLEESVALEFARVSSLRTFHRMGMFHLLFGGPYTWVILVFNFAVATQQSYRMIMRYRLACSANTESP